MPPLKPFLWKHNARTYTLSFDKPLIMGILNVTPDSFSDSGKYFSVEAAVERSKQLVSEGADILDIGGESTRPGSNPVPADEELQRVIPVIKALSRQICIPLSIDTYKPRVAEQALLAGAAMVNDITGLHSGEMIAIIAKHKVPVVIMHMQGTPQQMQANPHYKNVVKEVYEFLKQQMNLATKHGINQIIVDPGIGFGKTLEHNLELLKHLKVFTGLRRPLLVGTSRKSFIGKITNADIDQRLEGTLASNIWVLLNGANILRVHDVKEHKRALDVLQRIRRV